MGREPNVGVVIVMVQGWAHLLQLVPTLRYTVRGYYTRDILVERKGEKEKKKRFSAISVIHGVLTVSGTFGRGCFGGLLQVEVLVENDRHMSRIW